MYYLVQPLTLLFFIQINAYAALVERDWVIAGDVAITYDTATGLEWLDLPVTSNMSYNDVVPLTAAGQTYENFAYATEEQIHSLFTASSLEELPLGKSSIGPKIQALLQKWGVLWFLGSGERSEFITAITDGLPLGQHWSGRVVWTVGDDTGVTAKISVHDDNYKHAVIGSALVRNSTPLAVTGDVNQDGITNLGDLAIIETMLIENTVPTGSEPGFADYFPIGAPDGIINFSDLIIFYRELLL